jgi:hypothetical protein
MSRARRVLDRAIDHAIDLTTDRVTGRVINRVINHASARIINGLGDRASARLLAAALGRILFCGMAGGLVLGYFFVFFFHVAREAAREAAREVGDAVPGEVRVARPASRLAAVAARLLPAADRSRYAEEYWSELWDLAAAGAARRLQVRHALWLAVRALEMRGALREPRRRNAAP